MSIFEVLFNCCYRNKPNNKLLDISLDESLLDAPVTPKLRPYYSQTTPPPAPKIDRSNNENRVLIQPLNLFLNIPNIPQFPNIPPPILN